MSTSRIETGTRLLLKPGTLLDAAAATSKHGHRSGALQPILTRTDYVDEKGVRFVLRVLTERRAPKPRHDPAMAETRRRNPFSPYDPNLFVADISPTHVCLLNKFTVIDNHLLLVTREFEHQDDWLTLTDFEAFCACMAEFDGLAFYNAGIEAGASQPHKHLQYVPFPIAPSGENIPLAAKFRTVPAGRIETALDLPFKHAYYRFESDAWQQRQCHASRRLARYAEMLVAAGIDPHGIADGGKQTRPYNLLATRDWMLIVPRQRDAVEGISVNGLGFAGHLLARDEDQASFICRIGPLNLLHGVAVASS